MNLAREREIGAAVKQARDRLRYSQREFASALGITRDQVANIEAGRTPLPYRVAWSMRETFGLNLSLLAGFASQAEREQEIWMPPDSPEYSGRSLLFSEAAREAFLNPMDNQDRVAGRFPGGMFERAYFVGQLRHEAWTLMASVPAKYVSQAGFAAIQAMQDAGVKFPTLPPAEAAETAQDLDAFMASAGASHATENEGLTSDVNARTSEPVQPVLPKLIDRLKQATVERGSKAKLAAWLGVPRQCVTDWLSGRNEPGGETTLRLLQWVEAEERKQTKGPGSATTPPGPKTRSTTNHEKHRKPSPP